MLLKVRPEIPTSEITDERHYVRRREFIRLAGGAAMVAAAAPLLACADESAGAAVVDGPFAAPGIPLTGYIEKAVTIDEKLNTYEEVTGYNNFYEFGTGKDDPKRYSSRLKTNPWTVKVDGLCNKPAEYHLEDLIQPIQLEERIYRMRCVEGWSMVIPWIGVPLSKIIEKAEPNAKATFIQFTTLLRPTEMPGQTTPSLEWPYVEGLRMDEAKHPLTLLAVGMYGKTLLNQNGAPIRLVVPWKYGFKGIKSIVRIRFVDKQPATSWNIANAQEYGFYSNVNPQVDHPRWSQATERRIGAGLLNSRIPTKMFNGYADQVGSMYSGMDLRRYY
jgi:methionine sulfoxide reductase catalytic subunit